MPPYARVKVVGHPRSDGDGHVYTHMVVAERALGHTLPRGVEIHHVDGDKKNNAQSNLVICQDRDYHQFLHVRTRVVRAGGNPNTQRLCRGCDTLKPFDAFNRATADKSYGLQGQCRSCQSARYKGYGEIRRARLRRPLC